MTDRNTDSPASYPSEFEQALASWHEARLRLVTAPQGIAALVGTHWLTPGAEPVAIEGLDGTWRVEDGDIVGDDLTIEEGSEVLLGSRVLRHFRRDDEVALRVLDAEAPTRASVAGIDAYLPDEAWVLTGRFDAADEGATIDVEEIDGYTETSTLAGTVTVTIGGEEVSLIATGPLTGMQVVFADATSGTESYRFRFLKLRADGGTGPIEVDFNRAYLPPCAFADFYVCPLPPAQNRLTVPVRAGEKQVARR
ncbi:DUF1684 domain-containing protein [Herbiconiux flava]|uniref:DUF1684 domain-containing protein n=1 Tax=Herbiconiux flava TaxID=881268 RepID=A0A852SPD1_9MICO|nr:DUF1684 domain-containing protein [Herbiconiux flava]NYD70656.1 hypothetical protein [Herbiconiux flava]GLK17413.1 hypothetical protein GCM10017602_18950 [Herbiconiux flava]